MSVENNHYVALQEAVVSRLTSDDPSLPPKPAPANGKPVPILSEQRGDLLSSINNAIAKIGLVAIVLTPKALMIDPEAPGLEQMAPILVQVQENGVVNKAANGTRISALSLVVFIMKRLHFWPHGLYDCGPELMRVKLERTPFVLINDNPVVYNIAAWTPLSLDVPLKT
jgi:hypothetical protein